MNLEETTMLLTKIAAFDRRTIGEADVLAWHEVVGDLPLNACTDAVTDYFRDTREWCMPADIVSRVKALRKKRYDEVVGWYGTLESNVSREVEGPNPDAEDPWATAGTITQESDAAFRAEIAELRRRIQDGEWRREEYAAYRNSGLPLAEFDRHPNPLSFLDAPEKPLPLVQRIPEGWVGAWTA